MSTLLPGRRRWRALVCCAAFACSLATAETAPKKIPPTVKGTKIEGVYHGPVEIWSTPGTLQASGGFLRGQPDGRWTFWDDTGVKVIEVTYANGIFNGAVTLWYGAQAGPRLRGKVKLRGSFVDGMWQGLVRTYYPDGRTRSERNYEQGEVADTQAFNPQGQPFTPEHSRKVAAEDEQQDNAYVDAIDGYIRKWTS